MSVRLLPPPLPPLPPVPPVPPVPPEPLEPPPQNASPPEQSSSRPFPQISLPPGRAEGLCGLQSEESGEPSPSESEVFEAPYSMTK
ncbi:hypothetical protein FBR07_01640 [Candidatus Uhrbacteria bacterium UHB]|nr:hypothetical protein [Candidatus Uhrbacteria bacterium UHB]